MELSSFIYKFGTAEFDEARFELRVAGLPVDVERRALEVLAYLLRHSGEVVTKEELFREIWAGRVTVDKVLPNAVNKLRRALGEANAGYVTTVARLGYRLDGNVMRTAVGRQPASSLQLVAGQAVPGRPNFELQRRVGQGRSGEVWLAEHRKTGEQRVYKFALDGDRMRALKREVTLLRVLRESLPDCQCFVELLDWNFASAPFFIESKYGGESLADWAEVHLNGLETQGRIDLFLQVADAVAAAHSVGVLHKDLKPANVLVRGDRERPEIRLTDFGSGQIVEPEVLAQLGITNMGLTVDYRGLTDSTSGTPFYLAPELLTGHVPTVRSDVYALGILLYQLLSGRIGQPMASGWEQDIEDPLLREDLKRATAGDPLQRCASVHELTTRLRDLTGRAAQVRLFEAQRAEIEAAKQRVALANARRPYLIGLTGALLVGVVAASWLAQSATRSTERAETALAETRALNDFLRQDLISRSNPAVMAQGSSVPLKDVLLSAKAKIPERFAAQPRIRANVHHSLAELFSAIDQWPDAEVEARSAIALHTRSGSIASLDAQFAQSTLAIALARQGEFAESDSVIAALSRSIGSEDESDAQRFLLSHARAVNLFTKGSYAASVPEYALALDALGRSQPGNVGLINSVRRDQIHAQTVAGQYASAEANATAFLRELATRPGDQSLWIALIKRVSARSVGYQNRLDEAVTLLSEAEPAIREGFGTGSEQWLSLQNELMAVSLRQRRYERALEIAERLHVAARDQHGDDHPQAAKTRATWGFIAYEAEQDEQAYRLLRPSCSALVGLVGDKGALTQNCFVQLALVQVASGRMNEAEATLNKLDFNVLGSYRAVAEQRTVITRGVQGLIDLSRGDLSGREKVAVAIAAFERSAQPKDRFYRLLKSAAAGAT